MNIREWLIDLRDNPESYKDPKILSAIAFEALERLDEANARVSELEDEISVMDAEAADARAGR